jgi:hypothetical protein
MLRIFHFVDVFYGNVSINSVLLNVGHNVFTIQKYPPDGALTQDLLDGSVFGVVSHVIVVDIVFREEILAFTSFGVLVLSFHVKI